ncbi:NAD(P)/FAD-dependent oxidoreductase [Candidatus Bathyarchaeota archaeon]|nr:NAD(P)/FAD-dependent oxidoreductase [Candidatus Bathyarchaeota archaeon]
MVGAGPAGCEVARKVAEKGFKTLLCEEHETVGKPCHCTGKLTAHAFQDFDLPRETILNAVKGAVIHSPTGNRLSICKSEVDSYIIDRELFDLRLAEMACSSGSELLTLTRVQDLIRGPNGLLTLKARRKGETTELRSRLVIDAEGARPILPEKLGLRSKSEFLVGIQYEMIDVELESQDCVELYLGTEVAPGFFAWVVPFGEQKARVGLCVRYGKATRPLHYYLGNFLNQLKDSGKIKNREVLKTYVGLEPVSGPVTPSYADNMIVVGDSAGQVKSTSGGGIYFGLKAAEIAARTSIECLENDDMSKRALGKYEADWKETIGQELKLTAIMRRLLDRLGDSELDRLLQIMSQDDIRKAIEMWGDTAYQSRLLRPVLPRFLKKCIETPSDMILLARLLSCGFLSLLT